MKKYWISSAHQGFCEAGMHPNTLSAIKLAIDKGANMIETDVRTTADGVFIANHDENVVGFDENGNAVSYIISETHSSVIGKVILAPNDPHGIQYVPTLEEILKLIAHSGIRLNLDLKEGILHAADIAEMVCKYGLQGKVVYATNGSGAESINLILGLDPNAQFIDRPENFTKENLKDIPDYHLKCYAYTSDFSDENIRKIRESGCMLATISLDRNNILDAFRHHPEMAEYPHTSDFAALDRTVLENIRD